MTLAEKLARLNLIGTFLWIGLTLPSLLWWKASILWVILISLWANIVGHFSAYLAARAEMAQEKGHNLTKVDMEWFQHLLNSTAICPLHATTTTTNTAKHRYIRPS